MDSNLLAALERELPPLFFREAVPRLVPGMSARYLANLDSAGKGPPGRIRIGRKIAYPRADFIEWLEKRMGDVG